MESPVLDSTHSRFGEGGVSLDRLYVYHLAISSDFNLEAHNSVRTLIKSLLGKFGSIGIGGFLLQNRVLHQVLRRWPRVMGQIGIAGVVIKPTPKYKLCPVKSFRQLWEWVRTADCIPRGAVQHHVAGGGDQLHVRDMTIAINCEFDRKFARSSLNRLWDVSVPLFAHAR